MTPHDAEQARFDKAKADGLKCILFVCTGNAVRSQMAEGLINHFLGEQWAAFSAGVIPMDVPKNVVKVMHEIGIDIGSHRSKHVDVFRDRGFDRVVILCSDVDRICPNLPDCGVTDHLTFQDPLSSSLMADGFFFSMKATFRQLRDEMKKALLEYMKDK